MKHLDKTTILTGASPWTLAQTFTVTDKPYWLSAFGLGTTDKICVKKILRGTDGGGFGMGNCGITGPELGSIEAREFVERCGVRLCLCKGQPGLAITEPGEYELVASGDNVAAKLVTVIGEPWALAFPPTTPCKNCDQP
jgi:hypothetical protein